MTEPQTITKKELVNRIAESTGQTKVVVKDILQRFLDEIIDELSQGNRLEFREFGVFEVRGRAARRAQNPRTLEKVAVPAKRVVKFKVGRLMRERVCDERPAERQEPAKVEKADPKKGPGLPHRPPAPPTPPPSNSPF
jgi:integration host factor subunit beta